MRHCKKRINLNRNSAHSRSDLANLVIALVEHEAIRTTLAKAKLLRTYVEKLITRAKRGNLEDRRFLLATLYNNTEVVNKLIAVLGLRYANRPGGYVRILKLGHRRGDWAPIAYVELVDREEITNKTKRK